MAFVSKFQLSINFYSKLEGLQYSYIGLKKSGTLMKENVNYTQGWSLREQIF